MNRIVAYRQLYLVVSAFLSIVVLAQFLLLDDAYFDFYKRVQELKQYSSKYEFVVDSMPKDKVNSDLANIPTPIGNYTDITVVGITTIDGERYEVISYYPHISEKRNVQTISGASIHQISDGEIVIDSAINRPVFYIGDDLKMNIGDTLYNVIGIGNGRDAYEYTDRELGILYRIYCSYDDFYSIVNGPVELVVQYENPLSVTEERQLKDYVNFCSNVREYISPDPIDHEMKDALFLRFVFTVALSVFCLVCNYSIVSYLFFALKRDYQIRMICGAGPIKLFVLKVLDLLITMVVAFVIGVILYLIIISNLEASRNSDVISDFIGANFVVFAVSLIVTTSIGGIYECINKAR